MEMETDRDGTLVYAFHGSCFSLSLYYSSGAIRRCSMCAASTRLGKMNASKYKKRESGYGYFHGLFSLYCIALAGIFNFSMLIDSLLYFGFGVSSC